MKVENSHAAQNHWEGKMYVLKHLSTVFLVMTPAPNHNSPKHTVTPHTTIANTYVNLQRRLLLYNLQTYV